MIIEIESVTNMYKPTKVTRQSIKSYWAVILLLAGLNAQAQVSYSLSGDQEFKVSGTSTIHDWDMQSKSGVSGDAKIKFERGELKEILELKLNIQVSTFKSGKTNMDKNAYEALKAKSYPNIFFELREVVGISEDTVRVKGKLTIAGTTKEVLLVARYKVNGNTLTFTGSHEIKFTEFNIHPPTAMFNTIKTGDELNLSFNAQFTLTR